MKRLFSAIAALLILPAALLSCADVLGDNLDLFPEAQAPSGYGEEPPAQEGPFIPTASRVYDYLADSVTEYTYEWSEDELTVAVKGVPTARYTFDEAGRRLSTTRYRDGNPVRVTEYEPGEGEEMTVRSVTRYTYDSAGALTLETTENGEGTVTRQLTYAAGGGSVTAGFAYDDRYDERGRLSEVTYSVYGEGARTTLTRFTYGTPEGESEERLLSSTTTGSAGELLREVTYGAGDLPLIDRTYEGDTLLREKTYSYDEAGRLSREMTVEAAGGARVRDLDEFGNLTREASFTLGEDGSIPPEGSWEARVYPFVYRTDGEGRATGWTCYEEDGSVGGSFERTFGEDGSVTSEMSFDENGVRTSGWEEEWTAASGSDPAYRAKRTEYSSEGDLARREITYDAAGRVTSDLAYDKSDALLEGEENSYNASGALVRKISYREGAMSDRIDYSYDANGDLTRMISYDNYGNTDYRFELRYEARRMISADTYNGSGTRLAFYGVDWDLGTPAQRALAEEVMPLGLVQ